MFNIAQAGAHYVIGKLQLTGTLQSYAGETSLPISNGSTTLGTAVVTVSCIDTGAAPTPWGGIVFASGKVLYLASRPLGADEFRLNGSHPRL